MRSCAITEIKRPRLRVLCELILFFLWLCLGRWESLLALSAIIHKLVLGLLLGVDVGEADVVDPELEMLAVLHDSHGVGVHFE